jgi:hypothetical protein
MDNGIGVVVLMALLLGWIIAGITGFIVSLVCFGYKGSVSGKILGFVISFFFGPFYWIYYSLNNSYCTK